MHHPIHKHFGLGTTYDDMVYHAFGAHNGNVDAFVKKCQSILEAKEPEVVND